MSNNKQSSVELFAIALYEGGYLQGNGDEIDDLLERHKAMHEEEIMEAYHDGINLEYHLDMPSPKQYYEQTYGGNK